jgi:hypothetical protein
VPSEQQQQRPSQILRPQREVKRPHRLYSGRENNFSIFSTGICRVFRSAAVRNEIFFFSKKFFQHKSERCTSGSDLEIISTFFVDAALPEPNERCTSGSDLEIISTFSVDAALPDLNERCTSGIERTRTNAALLDRTWK